MVAHRIEHVGSTSVLGLAAKPVIDVMVTVDDPDDYAQAKNDVIAEIMVHAEAWNARRDGRASSESERTD